MSSTPDNNTELSAVELLEEDDEFEVIFKVLYYSKQQLLSLNY